MIRLKLDKLICIPVFFAALTGNTGLLALSYISIAIHEGAHLAAASLFGCRPGSIFAGCFGMRLDISYSTELTKRLVIRIAGPVASFLLFLIFQLLKQGHSYGIFAVAADINLLICIVNLMPVVPLDGGMLLRDIAVYIWGNIRGFRIVRSISYCVCGVYVLICTFIFLFAEPNIYLIIFAVCLCIASKKELSRIRLESEYIVRGIVREGTKLRYISLPARRTLLSAAEMISEYYFTVVGVFDRDRFVGELTQRDIFRCICVLSRGANLLQAIEFLKKSETKADTDIQI